MVSTVYSYQSSYVCTRYSVELVWIATYVGNKWQLRNNKYDKHAITVMEDGYNIAGYWPLQISSISFDIWFSYYELQLVIT